MLVNNVNDDTIGFIVEREDDDGSIVKEYEPTIMCNLRVKR